MRQQQLRTKEGSAIITQSFGAEWKHRPGEVSCSIVTRHDFDPEGEFSILEVNPGGSPCWITVTVSENKIMRNSKSRMTSHRMSLSKKHILQLADNLRVIAEKLIDPPTSPIRLR